MFKTLFVIFVIILSITTINTLSQNNTEEIFSIEFVPKNSANVDFIDAKYNFSVLGTKPLYELEKMRIKKNDEINEKILVKIKEFKCMIERINLQ